MDQYNLDILHKKLKIASLHIVRENIEAAILNALAQSDIVQKLIFYDGTALRLAYASPRFSEDLDFLMIKKIPAPELRSVLEIFIKDQPGTKLKDFRDKRNTLFALLNFKTILLKHPLNIKIEIANRKNGVDHEFIPLSSSCSHLAPIMPTATMESLERCKIDAINNRKQPRDWFDLWYISKYLKKPFQPPKRFPFEKEVFRYELKRFLPKDKWILIDQLLP
ncbi:MAG: nucleotidyl transferase AbiEii/AbiGii toxin family protein [Candidatus Jacksonbacteria bacterium]